jgi:hypothetical protein
MSDMSFTFPDIPVTEQDTAAFTESFLQTQEGQQLSEILQAQGQEALTVPQPRDERREERRDERTQEPVEPPIAPIEEDEGLAFARQEALQRRENAFGIINTFLQRAGLQGLEGQIRALLAQGIEDSDAILFNLRDTEQFRTRFRANTARANKGLPELDPATYIGLEQEYRSVLVANRLPTNFYDSPDDFEKLIEGDVSPSEFQSRINEGFAKVRDADPQVLNTLRQYYPEVGNDESALAAYFIDPVRANTVLQRQVEAARIGARGREQAGLVFGAATAEDLVRRGYSAEQAQAAFQRAGQLAGLYQEMGGEEALTEEQKVGAALGFDVQAQQALEQRQRTRLAEFMGGGGFARTSGATSGVVETGVGTAQ